MPTKIAYFINQYPKVSHTFIRREILAVEEQGFTVQRIALRGWDAELVDDEDRRERERTQYILRRGMKGLLAPLARQLLARPGKFLQTLALALRLAARGERGLPYHLVYMAEAAQIVEWTAAAGVNHVHAHFGTNSAEIVMLAQSLGGPSYSLTVHGSEEFDTPYALALDEKVSRSAFTAAVSSFCRSQLYRWAGPQFWNKIEVVHCGVDRAFYADAPVQPQLAPRLVCVGRLCEQKGHLLLLEAAAQLHRKGRDFELVLAGDGEMRPEVEEMIRRNGMQDKVRITGWISGEEVRDELLAARALVLPSFAEGLPVVVMEAMALRRPVLTTYVAGIPELVLDGENGWLFPASDIGRLMEAMDDCLAAPAEQLQRMGQAAHERVVERHSSATEAAKLARLFALHVKPRAEAVQAPQAEAAR